MTPAQQIAALTEALKCWQSYGCPDCHGDCGSANPPVFSCIMQQTSAALAAVQAPAEVKPVAGDTDARHDLALRLEYLSDGANPGPYGVVSYGSGTTYLTLGSWVGHYASDRVSMIGGGRAEIVNSNIPSSWGKNSDKKGHTAHFLVELANAYRDGKLKIVDFHPPAAPTVQDAARVPEISALIEAVSALGLRQLVAGWNGEDLGEQYPPHPASQLAMLNTTCGVVYAIDTALRAIAAHQPAKLTVAESIARTKSRYAKTLDYLGKTETPK